MRSYVWVLGFTMSIYLFVDTVQPVMMRIYIFLILMLFPFWSKIILVLGLLYLNVNTVAILSYKKILFSI